VLDRTALIRSGHSSAALGGLVERSRAPRKTRGRLRTRRHGTSSGGTAHPA
jgi:hypothetical protein